MQIDNSSGRAPSLATVAASTGLIVIVWAFNFIAAKIGLLTLPGLAMASFRVLVAGIVMSLLQIVTSIQDTSFSTVPRLLAFLAGIMLLLPWMLMKLMAYTTGILGDLPRFAR